MPDGKPTIQRKKRRLQFVNVWMPRALKADVKRLAAYENLPVSRFACGILRLGIGRYFELADAAAIEPLRAKMRDLFGEGEHFPPETNPWVVAKLERIANPKPLTERQKMNAEFDAAIEEGNQHFAALSG